MPDFPSVRPTGYTSHRTTPVSLLSTSAANDTDTRYLSQADCEALFRRIVPLAPSGDTMVSIANVWRGTTQWVRNAINTSSDFTDTMVTITRIIRGARGTAVTNQLDDESLRLAVHAAEQQVQRSSEDPDLEFLSGPRPHPDAPLFQQSTAQLVADERGRIARTVIQPAIASNVLAAGYLEARVDARGVYDTKGLASYYATTAAQYSTTVREPLGTGAGWAGGDHNDWDRLDPVGISKRALDKCLTSRNAVSIEPGRYVVILEPQAVHDLVRMGWTRRVMQRNDSEKYDWLPYNLRRAVRGKLGAAKFGMQLIDERLTVGTDPLDPEGGYLPFNEEGVAYRKVSWIDQGILRELAYDPGYALSTLNTGVATPYTAAYRMSGGDTALEEMIRSTIRGILVTRFLDVNVTDDKSLSTTGVTSGGTWLVEQGKLSRPIRNLRFNMSPLFALNNVLQIGAPQRVFSPGAPALVPPLKIREFNFTSTASAV